MTTDHVVNLTFTMAELRWLRDIVRPIAEQPCYVCNDQHVDRLTALALHEKGEHTFIDMAASFQATRARYFIERVDELDHLPTFDSMTVWADVPGFGSLQSAHAVSTDMEAQHMGGDGDIVQGDKIEGDKTDGGDSSESGSE